MTAQQDLAYWGPLHVWLAVQRRNWPLSWPQDQQTNCYRQTLVQLRHFDPGPSGPTLLEPEVWTRLPQAVPAEVRELQEAGGCHSSSKNYPQAVFRHYNRGMYLYSL